jgi:FkbM family methyltransferase
MSQQIEFHYPDGYTHGDIALSQEGWSYSPDDSHFGVWIREAHSICHDANFVSWCTSEVRSGSTIIDVGANIGTHTCGYLEVAKAVISIEPFSTSFECLKRNVLKKIVTCRHNPSFYGICGAVGSDIGTLNLEVEPFNHGASRIGPTGVTVLSLTLDSVGSVVPVRDVSLIKIDAEGYEGEILSGSGASGPLAVWRRSERPNLVIEVNHGALKAQGWSQDRLFAYLSQIRYYPTSRWPQELDSLTYDQLKGVPQYDIHCAPI